MGESGFFHALRNRETPVFKRQNASQRCRWGLTNEEVQAALTFARSPEAALAVPVLRSQKREILADLLRMMAVDGEIAEQERSLFALAAATMEFGQEELNRLIDEVLNRN